MANDLSQQDAQFPLAAVLDGAGVPGCGPGVAPFGLRYAVPAPKSAVVAIDYVRARYDDARQISVIAGADSDTDSTGT